MNRMLNGALAIAALFAHVVPASAANLLFSSGFEGIGLNAPSGGWETFSGTDSVTGFSWGAPSVWGGGTSLQVLDGTFVNQIQTVIGHDGSSTQALYQSVAGRSAADAQDPLIFTPTAPTAQEGDLYTSEWVKFQPDLATQLFPGQDSSGNWGNWRALFEWKTGGEGANYGGDYRIKVGVAMDGGGHLFWSSAGDNDANGSYAFQTFWQTDNHTVPVVAGQWFHLETFTHRSAGADGEFWAKVDGQTIVDHLGSNVGVAGAPINRIMVAQDYTGGHLPAYQWVDDVQIWDGINPVTTTPAPNAILMVIPKSATPAPLATPTPAANPVTATPTATPAPTIAPAVPNAISPVIPTSPNTTDPYGLGFQHDGVKPTVRLYIPHSPFGILDGGGVRLPPTVTAPPVQ